jgi:hypothetical protein
MLIEPFAQGWPQRLASLSAETAPLNHLYMLLDGAFVPGLHRRLPMERKALLFAALPGFTAETEDVSPFLTPFHPTDHVLHGLLMRCDRWPMVSAIATSETIDELADRLSAWCLVEADGQRFNFRFSDTRRLPAIFDILEPLQRTQIAGAATRWSFTGRDGEWRDLSLTQSSGTIAIDPTLDARQFKALVEDGLADELLVLLSDRGHDVRCSPSASHKRISTALRAARRANLPDDDVLEWCEWAWTRGHAIDDTQSLAMLETWRHSIY